MLIMSNKFLSLMAAGMLLAACECAPDSVGVGCAPAPGTPEDFKANVKDRVFFGYDKAKLSKESKHTLKAQAGWLKTYPNTKAMVEGHTDSRGTADYNMALGERRANAAVNGLHHEGISKDRLSHMSYGKDKQPVPDAHDEAGHAQNRVAVTSVQCN
jgi:peptidoglycan-associated lipoprotein